MSSSSHIDFTRVFDLFEYQANKHKLSYSASSFRNGSWLKHSISQLQQGADRISSWLMQQGIEKGDRIAIIPKMGSPEWMMVDFGCQQVGVVIVPLHATSSAQEMEFILKETGAKGCVALDSELAQKVKTLSSNVPGLNFVHDLAGFPPLLQTEHYVHPELESRKRQVTPDDLVSILYTSGTTGTPKGAMLSHGNIVSSVKSILAVQPLEPGQRALSFLPFSHIFERATCYAYLAFGVSIHFSTSLESLKYDFKSVRPHFFTCVPRTLEKMYDYLEEQRASRNFLKRSLISWAMKVGEHYTDTPGLVYRVKLFFARLLVLNYWRFGLGGKVKYLGVGAAALQPTIARLFSAAGILPLAGYGMTEASPFISANRYVPGLHRIGTVGLPVPGVEVRIEQPNEHGDGEIQVRGPNIMKGYYKRPDLTAEVFTDDGWLRTGDVGRMVDNRFLALTDRKKDIFKTSTGKYVAPQAVQNHLASSPFISQALVTGFNKPYVIAIVVPHFQLLKSWCEEHNIHWTSPTYMVHNIKVMSKYQEEIDRMNESLESHERVKKFVLSDEEWTVENKELTTSFKPMRTNLLEKHKAQIEKLYEG